MAAELNRLANHFRSNAVGPSYDTGDLWYSSYGN